ERRRDETGAENAHISLLVRATVRAVASCRARHGTGRGGRMGREISACGALRARLRLRAATRRVSAACAAACRIPGPHRALGRRAGRLGRCGPVEPNDAADVLWPSIQLREFSLLWRLLLPVLGCLVAGCAELPVVDDDIAGAARSADQGRTFDLM